MNWQAPLLAAAILLPLVVAAHVWVSVTDGRQWMRHSTRERAVAAMIRNVFVFSFVCFAAVGVAVFWVVR